MHRNTEMKHLIIISPVDSFAEITRDERARKLVFSNADYCAASVHSFVTSKAFGKDILSFINNLKDRGTINVVLLTGVDEDIMRLIATGCNIHYNEIVSSLNKDAAIQSIAYKYRREYSDILLLSAHATDIYAAQRNGVLGVFYGYDSRFPSVNSMEQFLKHLGISKA